MRKADCIFCKIVAGEAPSYQIWEDDKHLAFLTPFPNTEGFSVLITKDHHDSYFAELPDEVLGEMIVAGKKVAKLIDTAYDDVGRTGLIFEGFGVNHIHAKLSPMHGTKSDEWKEHVSEINTYFERYLGYISTNSSEEWEPEELERVAKKIRG